MTMPLDPAKIKARRERLKLSQTDAASRSSLARPSWSDYETGKRDNPSLDIAERIATALQCRLTSLLQ